MFDTSKLWQILQRFTKYECIIGGGDLPANFDKGALIITLINSQTLTQSVKDFFTLHGEQDEFNITAKTLIQNNYQIDLYRQNPINAPYIDTEIESQKVREYLKSYEVQEYLKDLNASILPAISTIQYVTDFNEQKKLINRAFFEVSIVYNFEALQKVEKLDKITLNGNLIIGG